MNVSIQKLGKEMSMATQAFNKQNNMESMSDICLDTESSTLSTVCSDGVERKFAIVIFGVLEENVFFWGDAIEEFSEYVRQACTEIRESLVDELFIEASHYALRVQSDTMKEAIELFENGGRYAIDDTDALLSRYSVAELLSVAFAKSSLRGVYHLEDEHEVYYFGIVSQLS